MNPQSVYNDTVKIYNVDLNTSTYKVFKSYKFPPLWIPSLITAQIGAVDDSLKRILIINFASKKIRVYNAENDIFIESEVVGQLGSQTRSFYDCINREFYHFTSNVDSVFMYQLDFDGNMIAKKKFQFFQIYDILIDRTSNIAYFVCNNWFGTQPFFTKVISYKINTGTFLDTSYTNIEHLFNRLNCIDNYTYGLKIPVFKNAILKKTDLINDSIIDDIFYDNNYYVGVAGYPEMTGVFYNMPHIESEPNQTDQYVFSVINTKTKKEELRSIFDIDVTAGFWAAPFVCRSKSHFTPAPDCIVPRKINFKFTGSAGDFHWNFGDTTTLADTSQSLNPTYTYPAPGTYNVRLITRGCVAADTFDTLINVPATPPMPFFYLPDTAYFACGQSSITLEPVNDIGGTFYRWSTGQTTKSINVTQAGQYNLFFENQYCSRKDSITVLPAGGGKKRTEYRSICSAQPFVWRGQTISQSGTYFSIPPPVGTCRDTFILQVTSALKTTSINASICVGDTYIFNGKTITSSDIYRDTLPTALCDSVVTLNLLNKPIPRDTAFASNCANQSFVWQGQSYNSSGLYSKTFTGSNGCDSVKYLAYTAIPLPIKQLITSTICNNDSVLFDGKWRKTSGIY